MLQLQNNTPFAADFSLFPNEEGIDSLYVNVKATFKIGKQWSLSNKQTPPVQADEYWGEPDSSSLKYPSDVHVGKLSTDIVMIGSAFSPRGEAVQQLDVSLRVGSLNKTIRVIGDRYWKNGYISQPVPFQMMPMVYERAYGGHYLSDGVNYAEVHNPIGLGFVGERSQEEVDGLSLPNLENPECLIKNLKDQPEPVCFSAVASYWKPRCDYAGTYDEKWQTSCAPYLPENFNKRFSNVASQDLIYPDYLQGGELVEIQNMHAQGNLRFNIPHVKLKCEVDITKETVQPTFNLETLLLEPNDLTISLVWRAAVVCDKKLIKIKAIKVNMVR